MGNHNIKYEVIFDYLKKDNNYKKVMKNYADVAISYNIYDKNRISKTDKVIMELWSKIFSKFNCFSEIKNSNEMVRLEQWKANKKSVTPFWYPAPFYKSSYAVKWYDANTWKSYKIVNYKEVPLKELVVCMFENFIGYAYPYDKSEVTIEAIKEQNIINIWKLLGHCFIWSDKKNYKYIS